MFNKSVIASELDLYIKEQVDNENYVQIDINKACRNNHQLHFVG